MTLLMSAHQPSRLRRMVVSCSWPCQCGRSCACLSHHPRSFSCRYSYWTISGRIGELKTAGRAWVCPLLAPSAPTIPTVGLFDILEVVSGMFQVLSASAFATRLSIFRIKSVPDAKITQGSVEAFAVLRRTMQITSAMDAWHYVW